RVVGAGPVAADNVGVCGEPVVGQTPEGLADDGFDGPAAPGCPTGADGVEDAVAPAAFDGGDAGSDEGEPEAQVRVVDAVAGLAAGPGGQGQIDGDHAAAGEQFQRAFYGAGVEVTGGPADQGEGTFAVADGAEHGAGLCLGGEFGGEGALAADE